MKRIAAMLAVLLTTGCFSVKHTLPAGAYFGTPPKPRSGSGTPFQVESMKNWFLSGLVPYTSYTTSNLLERQLGSKANGPLQIREIETVFTPLDFAISIVPGVLYGYYIWAPRSIKVSGSEMPAGASGAGAGK